MHPAASHGWQRVSLLPAPAGLHGVTAAAAGRFRAATIVDHSRKLLWSHGHRQHGRQEVRALSSACTRSSSSAFRRQASKLSPSTASRSLSPLQTSSSRTSQTRGFATISDDMSIHRSKYAAVVVGAGPAGICAVGNLLERKVGPILWVDDAFNGGRVNRQYREVPSNTKTKLFIDFAEAVTPFRNIVEKTPAPNAITNLRSFDQDKGTQLGNAADVLLMLTRGLTKTPGVEVRQGRVTAASQGAHKGWTVSLALNSHDSSATESSQVISDRLILCTGSSPTSYPLPVSVPGLNELDLDEALSPSKLAKTLSANEPTTIAVIGASHSAILVLLNLSRLALSTHPNLKVKWFTRHPLRYAVYMDGWILRDNTGLKGDAAEWARDNLEPEKFPSSPVSKCIEPISYDKGREKQVYEEHLPGCKYIVQAVGYSPDPIPELKRGVGTPLEVKYDHGTGGFGDKESGEKVPGLYGAGIAYPERVTDPKGNVEYAVGFYKFMKYLKRVSCDWN